VEAQQETQQLRPESLASVQKTSCLSLARGERRSLLGAADYRKSFFFFATITVYPPMNTLLLRVLRYAGIRGQPDVKMAWMVDIFQKVGKINEM
jgi:hypothetical protein